MKIREGDSIRIDGRLGRVCRGDDGEPRYIHRREDGVPKHPQAQDTYKDINNPGWSFDVITNHPTLTLVVFVGSIFLCAILRPLVKLFTDISA